jgi:hypothetical protein
VPRAEALRAFGAAWRIRAEVMLSLALMLGWASLTMGVARLTSPIAWFFSIGVLLLSLCGWGMLAQLCWKGLYVLSRKRGGRDA